MPHPKLALSWQRALSRSDPSVTAQVSSRVGFGAIVRVCRDRRRSETRGPFDCSAGLGCAGRAPEEGETGSSPQWVSSQQNNVEWITRNILDVWERWEAFVNERDEFLHGLFECSSRMAEAWLSARPHSRMQLLTSDINEARAGGVG